MVKLTMNFKMYSAFEYSFINTKFSSVLLMDQCLRITIIKI